MKHLLPLVLLISAVAFGQEFKLGSKVTDFQVQDPGGAPAAFATLRGPVTVVIFISTQCPISNAYNDRMSAVYGEYSGKGVKFIFVNANRNESAREVAEHAKSVGFPFPVYKDPGNSVADRFDAQVTPECFVVDRNSMVVYHGQVDDNRNEARISRRGLRMALDAVLAGKPVPVAETKAFGCTIKRLRRTS